MVCANSKRKGHTVSYCRDELTPEGVEALNLFKRQQREKREKNYSQKTLRAGVTEAAREPCHLKNRGKLVL